MTNKKGTQVSRQLCLAFLCVFFITQYILLGYRRVPDTVRLENFSHAVYPLYPLVLFLFRTIFGVDKGYYLLGLVQNVVLILSIFSLIDYIQQTYKLSVLTSLCATVAVSAVFIGQKWFTHAGIISSNTLFSEAFAIPFYLWFFRYSLEAFTTGSMKPFLVSCIWSLCLILTRGQFYWVLVVVFLNGIRLTGMKKLGAVSCAILACVSIIVGVQSARYIQNKSHHYEQTKNPANLILLSTAVYCSESNDYLLFDKGSGERTLLESVRIWMDDPAQSVGYIYESGDLIQRHTKFEAEYDPLKAEINKSYKLLIAEDIDLSLNTVTAMLILSNLVPFLLHCGQNFLVALIRTVAILRPGLEFYSLLFYFVVVLILVNRKDPKFKTIRKYLFLAMVCTLLNAFTMAPGVFALSRYVFYNMPVLYLGVGVYITQRHCHVVAHNRPM